MEYGGLEYRSVDIQTPTLFLDLQSSPYEPAEYRGRDDVIPGRPGRFRRNRVADNRIIVLKGWTRGVGGTRVERQQSWNDAEAILLALLDPSLAPGDLTVLAPYMGLTGGSVTIEAVGLNWVPGPVLASMAFRRWSIELEAVGNPPDWTDGET